MTKILFEINYNIYPEKREEYLKTIEELKNLIRENSTPNYFVFEDKKNPDNFTELFICESEEEYENIEDFEDERAMELTAKLFSDYIENKKVKYITKHEI